MKKARKRSLVVRSAAVLLALLVVGGPWLGVAGHRAHAATLEPLNLTVEVSYKGFNEDPNFTIEAQHGQEVNVTFIWADAAVPDNAHRIYIEGYDLQTRIIDAEDREDTISFMADQAGSFSIECDWRCEGHKEALQSATLSVSGGGAGGDSPASASFVATSLAFGASAAEVDRGPVALSAELADAQGNPIADAHIRFYVDAELAGTAGPMQVGAATTDADGVATYEYVPTFEGEQTVTARFDGMGLYAEAEQTFPLAVTEAEPAYTLAPPGLESLKDWAPAGVALVVGSVWATFAFVAYQVYRLAREPRGGGVDGP